MLVIPSLSLSLCDPSPGSSTLTLPIIRTSMAAKNSVMAAVHAPFPNSCAIEVFRAIRFLPLI
jgi:hypothetical protein